jgi:hypothetical protein
MEKTHICQNRANVGHPAPSYTIVTRFTGQHRRAQKRTLFLADLEADLVTASQGRLWG